MTRRVLPVVFLATLFAAGCLPEKRIVWSPDGSRAAVVASDGLRFCSPDGTLSEPVLKNVRRVAWFTDGRRLLVVRTSHAVAWEDVARILSPEEQKAIAVAAAGLREEVLAFQGPWDQFKPRFGEGLTGGMQAAAFLYLRDNLGQGLAEHVGEKWNDIRRLTIDLWRVQVFAVDGDRLTPGTVLHNSVDEFQAPSVAPTGRAVAFLRPGAGDGKPTSDLHVAPADGSAPPRLVARQVAHGYSWSPDGRALAYLYAPGEYNDKHVVLGALASIEVADEQGDLLETWARQEDRAGLLFSPYCAVQWLADGRLIFSSYEVTLPATTRDMPQQWGLFALDPRMSSSVIRLFGRDIRSETDSPGAMFSVSPNGRRVLIPGSAGRVTLYDFATGHSEVIVERVDSDTRYQILPTWRNDDEACVLVPPGAPTGSPERSEVILWTDGGTHRKLSANWPEAAVQDWLTPGRKPATDKAGG